MGDDLGSPEDTQTSLSNGELSPAVTNGAVDKAKVAVQELKAEKEGLQRVLDTIAKLSLKSVVSADVVELKKQLASVNKNHTEATKKYTEALKLDDYPFSLCGVAEAKIASLSDTWHAYDLVIGTSGSIGFRDKEGDLKHTVRHPTGGVVQQHLKDTPDATKRIEGEIWNVVGTTASHTCSKSKSSLASTLSGKKFWESLNEDCCIACGAANPEIAHVCCTPREKWRLYMKDCHKTCTEMFVAPLCSGCNNKDREADPRTSKALHCNGNLYCIPLLWDEDEDGEKAAKRHEGAQAQKAEREQQNEVLSRAQEEERVARDRAMKMKGEWGGATAKKAWVTAFNKSKSEQLRVLEATYNTATKAVETAKKAKTECMAKNDKRPSVTAKTQLNKATRRLDNAQTAQKQAKDALTAKKRALDAERASAEQRM